MTISLSDLKAKRAAMTPGEWKQSERDQRDVVRAKPEDGWMQQCIARAHPYWANAQNDSTGIVATHNAADALIEIATAALALRDSRCDCTTEFHDSTSDNCAMGRAEVKLAALLSKITP